MISQDGHLSWQALELSFEWLEGQYYAVTDDLRRPYFATGFDMSECQSSGALLLRRPTPFRPYDSPSSSLRSPCLRQRSCMSHGERKSPWSWPPSIQDHQAAFVGCLKSEVNSRENKDANPVTAPHP